MKANRFNRLVPASLLALATSVIQAGTLYFDGTNIDGNGNGAADGVSGTWNTTNVNWDQGDGLPRVVWDNTPDAGDSAVFGGPIGNNNRTVTVTTVNAVDMDFFSGGTLGATTRWTLSGGTITLGDTVNKMASIDASAMLAGSTVGVNVISTLVGDVSGGLTLTGSSFHGTSMAATAYASYFTGLNPTRVNLLSLSNTGTNSFTGPVTITNAVEIQGLTGSRFKALGAAANTITLNNGTLLLYANNGTLDQNIAVTGTINALNQNNNTTSSTISGAITSGNSDVLWSVAGSTNGRITYTGNLSGFTGTLKVKGSATGATVLNHAGAFGGAIEVESGSLLVGNNTASGSLGGTVLNNSAIVFNRTDDYSYSGVISGTGSVTKQGARVLTLAGANNYSGTTTVTAGRLNLTGSLTSNLSVTGGAVSGTGSTTGTLTMAAGTSITLAGGANTTSLSANGVTFSGATSLEFVSAPVATTVYDVVTYGAGGVTDFSNFSSYIRGTLFDDTGAQKITFTAAAAASLTWDGATGTWDQINTANWNTGVDQFYDWDSVAFNDPGGPATVTLTGTLRPASVSVTNTAGNNYTFSGSGSLAGVASLTKSGTGTLVLTTANSYSGSTTINAGTLRLENTAGAGVGAISIGDGTLSLFRTGATTTYPNLIVSAVGTTGLLTVDGSGVDAGTGTNSTYTLGGIQVDGSLTITRPTGSRGLTQYNGQLSGSGTLVIGDNNGGFNLVVDNTSTSRGRAFFANTNNTFNGHVHVLERGNFLNNTANPSYQTLIIDAGAAITLLTADANSLTTVGRFNGEGIVARNTSTGQATLVVGGANQNDSFSGIIDAALFTGASTIGLTKNGTATQTLSGTGIRHNGITTVNNGMLKLEDTSSWASAIVFRAADSPVLEFAGSASYTVAGTITGGSANASLVKSSGGTLTLSGANTFTGAISVAAGTLKAGSNQAFGGNDTVLTVADGAAIDTGGTLSASRDYHAVIQGAGVGGTGAIVNSSAVSHNNGFRSITLTENAAIGGSARWDVRPITAGQGLVDLDGKTLTKTGGNIVPFVNSSITAGTIDVSSGILTLTRSMWPTGSVNVLPGATLQFENNTVGEFSYGMAMSSSDANMITIGSNVETTGSLGLSGTNTLSVAVTYTHTQSGVLSGNGSLDKTSGGTLALGAATHTYGGTITVSAGSLLVNGTKSGSGSITVGTGATVGGTGSISGVTTIEAGGFVAPGNVGIGTLTQAAANLAGTYRCQIDGASADRLDITGALDISTGATVDFSTLAAPTEDEYVIATYGALSGVDLNFTNLPAGYDVDDSTTGVIKLVRVPGYAFWADSWTGPVLSDKTPGGDPDHDGISNLLEYVLGGDPRVSDTGILPGKSIDGAFLVLSYTRNDASELDTTQTGQWSGDMADWNPIAPVLVEENGEGPDDMEIRIPLANEVDGKLFGRLKVEETPTP